MRCRPESAPLSPAWIGKSAIVQRAIKVLNFQEIIDFNEDDFANKFGVSARHLRKLFNDEIGKTPKQISFENRLNLARKLITETSLSMSDVAYASGFNSIRRFNDSFKERFKKAPREIRRFKKNLEQEIHLELPYRPPFDYEGLYMSYQNHRIGDLEWFVEGTMFRFLHHDNKTGYVRALQKMNETEREVLSDVRPWRGYAASLIWCQYALTLRKKISNTNFKGKKTL